MQYFLGYSTFSKEAPFDATLFVEIRERLGLEGVTSMNEALCRHLGVIPSKDELSWNAFNEGSHLVAYLKSFKERMGHYPKEVLMDGIYSNRENRLFCKENHIKISGKPLGRPPKDPSKRLKLRPGDRNPVEGKFGQAKTAYGMNRIRARLKVTSETWIAKILLVVNLVKSTRRLPYWVKNWSQTFSALLNGHGEDNLAPNENWLKEYALQAKFRHLLYLKYN